MNEKDIKVLSSSSRLRPSTLWKIRGKSQWALLSSGKTFHSGSVWIRWCSPEEYQAEPLRLGCAVSSKYGNAVARNKFKRRVKVVVRKKVVDGELKSGLFLLVGVTNSTRENVTFNDVENAFSAFISSLK